MGGIAGAIFGLLGWSWGAYKWYMTRQSVLFERLKKYLEEDDPRLLDAESALVRIIRRPGPRATYRTPLFSEPTSAFFVAPELELWFRIAGSQSLNRSGVRWRYRGAE